MLDLNAIYLNQYIYSPVTKYHKVSNNAKLFIIHNTILILLYFNISKIVLFLLILLIIIIWIKLYNSSRNVLYKILKNNILYLLNIIFINYLIDNKSIKKADMLIKRIFVPYKLDIRRYKYQLKYYDILYFTPQYISKLLHIYIINYNLNHILFIFLQSEVILETLIRNFNYLLVLIGSKYNDYIVSLYLGYQSLENIIKIWSNNSTGRHIKVYYLNHKQLIDIIIVLVKYYYYILSNESGNSTILWNRSLLHTDFTEIKYYY